MAQSKLALQLAAIILACFLSLGLPGCTLAMLHQIDRGQALTPEQIKAYEDAGFDVYGCFMLTGPPPLGSTSWLVVPKGSKVSFKFGDGCRLLN